MKIRNAKKLALALCEFLNTPRSLTVMLLLAAGEYEQLSSLRCDPSSYLDTPSGVEKYRRDVQSTDFLRKFPVKIKGLNRRREAEASFQSCEISCFKTNEMLRLHRTPSMGIEWAWSDVVRRGRNWLGRCIGRLPPSLVGRFGPGTSFELKGSTFSTVVDKLHTAPGRTPACAPVLEHTWGPTLHAKWRAAEGLRYVQDVRGNRFTTVPKTARTDRGICIEPLGNLFCQLGVGSYLKQRLAKVGIFVQRAQGGGDHPLAALLRRREPNGQTLHREWARLGSITGDLSTIDLSNASDTVAYELVRDLVPDEWFQLLDALRSPATLFQGKWVRLEKFSSMGNGFTFELETLIFCALVVGVTGLTPGRDFLVYGDDIIVPGHCAPDVLACLRFAGFEPNERKTFVSGHFRESCGGDYFMGVNVTPIRLTHTKNSISELYSLHNHFRRSWPSGWRLRRVIAGMVPKKHRHFGPPVDDTFLHTTDSRQWRVTEDADLQCTLVEGLVESTEPIRLDRWTHTDNFQFVCACLLLGVSSRGPTPQGGAVESTSSFRSVL